MKYSEVSVNASWKNCYLSQGLFQQQNAMVVQTCRFVCFHSVQHHRLIATTSSMQLRAAHTQKKNEDKARQCKRSQAIETFKSVNVQFEAGGEACIVFLGGNSGGDVLARPPVWPSSAPVLFSFFKKIILLFILVFS